MKTKVGVTFKRALTSIIILAMIISPMHVAVVSAIEDPHDAVTGEHIVGDGIDTIFDEENNYESGVDGAKGEPGDEGTVGEPGDEGTEGNKGYEGTEGKPVEEGTEGESSNGALEIDEQNNSASNSASDGASNGASYGASDYGVSGVGNVLSPFDAGPYTVEFFLGDGSQYGASQVVNEGEQAEEPDAPSKLNLNFAGWYIDGSDEPFDFENPIEEDLQLYVRFTATVTFYADDLLYGESQIVFEGDTATKPTDPEKDGYTFVEWRSFQYGVFNFDTAITGHLDLTARFTKDDTGAGDRYANYWAAGPGGSIRNFTCPDCGYSTGNSSYSGHYVLYFYPMGAVPTGERQLALIVVTCINCGTISELSNTSNGGASLSGPGQAPGSVNNMGVGDARLIAMFVSITFQPGSNGQLSDNGPGAVEKVANEDLEWDAGWEPTVYPDAGFSHIGWRDQDGNTYSVKGSFPSTVDKSYVFTAVYSNNPVITIIADSAEKAYDGTALTANGWTARDSGGRIILGLRAEGLQITGSQTEVGSSLNVVTIDENTRFFDENGDITDNFIFITKNGDLVVTPKIVRVAADNKTKVYGEADPELTAAVTGLSDGETLDYTLSRIPGEDVGSYDVIVTLGDNPNYSVEKDNGVFTITPKSVDVKVTANDKTKVYGDADPELTATVTGLINGDTLNYTLSRTPGENVGTYDIVVTLGNNPNYMAEKEDGIFTITPKSIGVKVTAENKTKIYGEADPALTAIVTGAVGADILNYTLARTPGENVGEYNIIVTLGNNPNYIVTKQDGTFTITPKSIGVKVTAENKTKIYGEADPALTAIVTGAVGDDVLNYTLARDPGENVGEYDIIVTLGDNPNYIVTKQDGTFTITPKSINVKVTAENKSKVYGETDPALTAIVTGTVGNDTLNYTLERTPGENVGEYDITVTLGDNPNYNVTKQDGTFTITPKGIDVKVTAENKTKIYGEADPALTAIVTGLVGNDTLNYTLERAPGENAGTYDIIVTLGSNPNYSVTKQDGTLTITPKSIGVKVTAENKTKVYGEADPALTAIVTGLVGNDTLNYTLAREPGENAGEYDIIVTLGSNPNYIVSTQDGTLTITPKTVIVKADNKTKEYGAADPALTATVSGAVGSDTINYTLKRAPGENVGDYDIIVTLGVNSNNYVVEKDDGVFSIIPSGVVVLVKADDKAKVYGDADPALTATVTGLVGNDTLNYTLAREPGENVGTYDIIVTLGDNPNYTVTKENGTFTITPKEIGVKVTADNKSKAYGDADPALTATVTGAVGDDTLNYTLSRTPGENVGTYDIIVTLGNNPNYIVSKQDGLFTITPKSLDVKVTAENKTKIYGETDPALTAIVTGLVGNDSLNYSLAREPGENVGIYKIIVTLGNNPNYTVAKEDGVFTITRKIVGVKITADDKTKVYGDADPALTAKETGLVGDDTLDYTLTRAPGEDVGAYPIIVTLGYNPNYYVETENAVLTIMPKSIGVKVTADDKTKIYGDADPVLTTTVTGLVGNDSLNYALAREPGENVGTYEITVTLGENPNYIVAKEDGVLTITPKSIGVKVTAENKTKVYGDADPALTAVVTGLVSGDELNYALARTTGENVGNYAITVTLGENPNYIVAKEDGILTITPKTIGVSVTAENKTKVYGDADPVLTAIVTGMVGNDSLNYTLARAAGENVGTYEITVTLGENPNYIVAKEDGELTITPKTIGVSVTADNKTKVYGAADPALTAVVTGLVSGDELNYTLARAEGENVGTYPITVTLGENPNYIVATEDGVFTITPKRIGVSVTAEDKAKVYGDTDPELTAIVTGLVGSDKLDYTLARVSGENAGVYDIVVTLGNNPNYIVEKEDGELTISPRAVTITVSDAWKYFADADPVFTGSVEGLVNADDLGTISFIRTNETEEVGNYSSVLDADFTANDNYDAAVIKGDFEIIASNALSVRLTSSTIEYDGEEHALAAAVPSVTGATLTYTYNGETTSEMPAFVNAGAYEITVTAGMMGYNSATATATLTITRKPASVNVNNMIKEFGSNDEEFTATTEGFLEGEAPTPDQYTITRTGVGTTAGESVGIHAGALVIANNGFDDSNYDISWTDGDLTITATIPSLSTTSSSSNRSTPNVIIPDTTLPLGAVELPDEEVPLAYLEADDHRIYLYGYPDYTVKPEQSITRAEAASIFYRLLQDKYMEGEEISGFNDVDDDEWFAPAINRLAELGIILGYANGSFRPNAPITRAEFATIAARFDNLSPVDGIVFDDVSENHWAIDFIHSAYAAGWVDGYEDGTFLPEKNISRAEVVKIVNTMLNRLPKNLPDDMENPYTDIEASHWAYIHIIEASIEHKYDREENGIEKWLSYIPGGYLARQEDNEAEDAGEGGDAGDAGEAEG